MSKVYAVRCEDYGRVEDALAELLAMMGGIERFAKPGESIALKPNLVHPVPPELGITTHPAVVAAVGRAVKECGARPFLIDSPSGEYPRTAEAMGRLYRTTGMAEVAAHTGIALDVDVRQQSVFFPQGVLIKHFDVLAALIEADGVLSLCKLKTHTYMGMTGGIKNLFGAIPGSGKPGYHVKLRDPDRFAGMLLDLAARIAPRLTLMDAVIGMEGAGPNRGTLRHVGLLLASEDPLALDVVASEIIGLPVEHNPVLREARRRGRTPTRIEEVELAGLSPAELRIRDYDIPLPLAPAQGLDNMAWWQTALMPLFRNAMTRKPHVLADTCTGCDICRAACPQHAIALSGNGKGRARIDDSACIRCYTCYELCPEGAIELRRGVLCRIMNA